MISQANCTAGTAMGANLVSEMGVVGGGATFRTWAPRATAVYVNGVFGGVARSGKDDALLMAKDANGYWSGFMAEAAEGDTYRFYVVGEGSEGYKRDPYARELANDVAAPFPVCAAVIREAKDYPWHDAGFRTPDFADMVVYQLHIGTYAPAGPGWASTYLDVAEKVEYLAALGVNVVQPLPVYEEEDSPSQGYPGLGYQGIWRRSTGYWRRRGSGR
jgi:1,4-alpha-glucan branching enzyme